MLLPKTEIEIYISMLYGINNEQRHDNFMEKLFKDIAEGLLSTERWLKKRQLEGDQ